MKLHSAPSERNSAPIGEVLDQVFPEAGRVLEVAAGTGQHAIAFAGRYPGLIWQPSDVDADALASIRAYAEEAELANLQEPILLDVSQADWDIGPLDAILCVNMVHISPWAASEGLFAGAARSLPGEGPLVLYGPYLEEGVPTAPSNLAFDESLKARNPAWGLRDAAALDTLAHRNGFTRTSRHVMPANNLMLVYRRA